MNKKKDTKIGLGLAALGRPEYINIRTEKDIDKSQSAFEQNTLSVLDEAYALGVRYFDTAPSYGKGEAFLQNWHNNRNHDDVVLGTKWGYTYKANWELGYDGKHEVKEHSLSKLLEQWAVSKAFLPHLKYYQIHSATFESGVLENKEVLRQLHNIKRSAGLKIGLSASGSNQKDIVASALNIAVDDMPLFDSFQVTFNVFEQSTTAVLREAMSRGKHLIIKEALANGRVFQNDDFQNYKESYKLLTQLAEKYQVGIDAIALRFVMDDLKPDYVLSGASSINQLKSNLKAKGFRLSANEINALKSLSVLPKTYWDERSKLHWN